MGNTNKTGTVKVRYKGVVKGFVADMRYLKAGPYDFSDGTCDVCENDSERMISQCPGSFSLVGKFSCKECGKKYVREGDLKRHIANTHKK